MLLWAAFFRSEELPSPFAACMLPAVSMRFVLDWLGCMRGGGSHALADWVFLENVHAYGIHPAF